MIDQTILDQAREAERDMLASVRLAHGEHAAEVLMTLGMQARALAVALTLVHAHARTGEPRDAGELALTQALDGLFADVLAGTVALGFSEMPEEVRSEIRPFVAQIVKRSFVFVGDAASSHMRNQQRGPQ